jgi:hypothetical protein
MDESDFDSQLRGLFEKDSVASYRLQLLLEIAMQPKVSASLLKEFTDVGYSRSTRLTPSQRTELVKRLHDAAESTDDPPSNIIPLLPYTGDPTTAGVVARLISRILVKGDMSVDADGRLAALLTPLTVYSDEPEVDGAIAAVARSAMPEGRQQALGIIDLWKGIGRWRGGVPTPSKRRDRGSGSTRRLAVVDRGAMTRPGRKVAG